jgi:uroporphyrinogen III methyltransferase/synthase
VQGHRITIVRASRGQDTLAESLTAAGADVSQVVAYQHTDVEVADPSIVDAMTNGEIDWVTVTSSASAVSLHHLLGGALKQTKLWNR